MEAKTPPNVDIEIHKEIERIHAAEKKAFEERKKPLWRIFTVLKFNPPKYPSRLHKKVAKFIKTYDKASNKPIRQARILRSAMGVERRIANEKCNSINSEVSTV